MRILFNVAHPAHVHLFKNPISLLDDKGHEIEIAALERETTRNLLNALGLPHTSLGKSHKDLLVKYVDTVRRDVKMARLIKATRPDILVSTGIPYSAQAGRICGIPSVAFSDTEIATLVLQAVIPFVSAVCTPSCFYLDLGPKHVRYDGYHELAYLSPKYFSPDPSVLDGLGLEKDDTYVLLRVSSADSSHDSRFGKSFLDHASSGLKFLRGLELYGRVLLTSEVPLPKGLREFQVNIEPHLMHDLISFATLYVGEGATMASEAGVLGVPWVYVSNTTRGYLTDQEHRYGLGYTVADWKAAEEKAADLMGRENLKSSWQAKRKRLLSEKVDVSEFIADFVGNWPESFVRLLGEG